MRVFLPFLLSFLAAGTVQGAPDPSALCETAITSAEYAGGLPPRLLMAIALVESGRYDEVAGAVRPWPWTINAAGEGHYYASKAEAIDAVKAFQARGVRSIDVGCMQVNLMHHPDAFASLDEAFNASANAVYAAKFLTRLRGQGEDWSGAIGAYHSATSALGDAYRVLVMLRWKGPNVAFKARTEQAAYRAFQKPDAVYGAFAQAGHAYGASAVRR
jgi:hypothetical protein